VGVGPTPAARSASAPAPRTEAAPSTPTEQLAARKDRSRPAVDDHPYGSHPQKPPDRPPLQRTACGRLTPRRGKPRGTPLPTAARVPQPRFPPRTPPSFPGPPEAAAPLEFTLARNIVQLHWAGTASDMYLANSMSLPVGLGLGLEARLADLRRNSVSPSEVAFKLVLPVVDGLPVKELLALRESESDAFEGFRDSLTEAIKDRLVGPEDAVEDVGALADELRSDVIDPALHRIQRRLRAAEGLLRKNYRYNIALAGLATMWDIYLAGYRDRSCGCCYDWNWCSGGAICIGEEGYCARQHVFLVEGQRICSTEQSFSEIEETKALG
jgi:hypothetical protein